MEYVKVKDPAEILKKWAEEGSAYVGKVKVDGEEYNIGVFSLSEEATPTHATVYVNKKGSNKITQIGITDEEGNYRFTQMGKAAASALRETIEKEGKLRYRPEMAEEPKLENRVLKEVAEQAYKKMRKRI